MEKTRVIKLVDRSHNACHWTPEEALMDTLERVRSGEFNPKYMAIHWADKVKRQHRYCWAGGRIEEHVSLLTVGQIKLSDNWK